VSHFLYRRKSRALKPCSPRRSTGPWLFQPRGTTPEDRRSVALQAHCQRVLGRVSILCSVGAKSPFTFPSQTPTIQRDRAQALSFRTLPCPSLMVINKTHLHGPGGVRRACLPQAGGLPLPAGGYAGLPAAGGKAAHVTATTPTPPTRTAPHLQSASPLHSGWPLRSIKQWPTTPNLESAPKKTFSSNDQTIKARPFPGRGTERRPAPPFGVDAGHDIVSRPISRVLYPPERTVAIYLGWRLPATSCDQPEDWAGRPIVLLFGLAPGGVCPAGRSPDRW